MSTEVEAPSAVESLRDVGGSIRSMIDQFRESASVESVYGDAVEVGDVTMIPVARVAYGVGGGFGSGQDDDEAGAGDGAGMGGAVTARPVGVVEIAHGQTRFVRFAERRAQLAALGVGLLVGLLLGRRRGGS